MPALAMTMSTTSADVTAGAAAYVAAGVNGIACRLLFSMPAEHAVRTNSPMDGNSIPVRSRPGFDSSDPREREEVGKHEGQVVEVVVLEVLRSCRLRDKACFDEVASFSVGVHRSQVIRCANLLEVYRSGTEVELIRRCDGIETIRRSSL